MSESRAQAHKEEPEHFSDDLSKAGTKSPLKDLLLVVFVHG